MIRSKMSGGMYIAIRVESRGFWSRTSSILNCALCVGYFLARADRRKQTYYQITSHVKVPQHVKRVPTRLPANTGPLKSQDEYGS